jgi:hypothetical protein
MSIDSDYATITEAAGLLGVTTRHVARLGEQGEILIPFRGVVDRGSVDRYLAERAFSRARAWDERTAWAAVALLSGLDVDWLGQVQTSRLRGRLRLLATADVDGAHELIGRARERAAIKTYETFGFVTSRVKKEVLVVGRRGLGLAAARGADLDAYLSTVKLPGLEKRYALRPDTRGRLLLRVTGFDLATIKGISVKGNGALAALDAATAMDPRERGVGVRALTGYLKEFARG